jgi:hypothetical protein
MLYKILCDEKFVCGGWGLVDAKKVVSEYIEDDKVWEEHHNYKIVPDDFKG